MTELRRSRKFRVAFLAVCLMACASPFLHAQDDPFGGGGGDPFGGDDPFNPGAAAQANPAIPVAPVDASSNEILRRDATVEAIIGSNPTTPIELLTTIDLLLNIDRDDLARNYVEQLAGKNLTPEQSYQLFKQAGSSVIFRMGTRDGIAPEGMSLAQSILNNADQFATSGERIQQLAETAIRNEDKYQRSLALADLQLLGDTGVAVLIDKLVDPAYEAQWPRIRQAVRLFGFSAEEPLIAALHSNSLKLRMEAIYLLRNVRSNNAIEALLVSLHSSSSSNLQKQVAETSLEQLTGDVPNIQESEARLFRAARQYLMDEVVIGADAQQMIKWWRWDNELRSLVPAWLSSRAVSRIRGFQRAGDLVELNSGNQDYQRLYWVARLETAKLTAGLQSPLPESVRDSFVATIDPDMALSVLSQSLDMHRIPAAIAACEVLGGIGDAAFLESSADSVSPLIRALDFGSLRLANAATNAIFEINPTAAFSGSSEYQATLVHLSRSSGMKTAIVGLVNLEQAQSLSAIVSRSGFAARPALTSQQLFDQAQSDPDLQLIVVTDTLSRPGFSELVQTLRSAPTTSKTPILLMVDEANMNKAYRLSDRYDNLLVSPAVNSDLVIARQIDNLNQSLANRDAGPVERADFAAQALDKLVHYASRTDTYPFMDLASHQDHLMSGLLVPSLAENTCRLLGYLGTADAQRRLVETVNNLQLPISLRQVAAESFGVAVANRGLMLSRDQLLHQYDRYNASRTEPVESQQVLGAVLDILEKRPSR